MGIDFQDEKNRHSYSTRKADSSWTNAMEALVDFKHISKALDLGCDRGIYSKALWDIGVLSITDVDYSEEILKAARENCAEYPNISFTLENALQTDLESNYMLYIYIKKHCSCWFDGELMK